MKIPLLLFFFSFLMGNKSAFCINTIKKTHLGPIQGTTKGVQNGQVQAFLGIPYAEPPLGSQRFLKPKPVKPWTEILKAIYLPPACPQYTIYPFPWYDDQPGKSEDCLYLNIYAPIRARKGSNLAVLFFIHGGGFLHGSSRMDVYDASAMAYFGDVIIITFNYRLNVLGFLTSNTSDAPGNIGIYDMVAALQWVNKNIEPFGGDKGRITLAGESVGSISVSLLCVSPLTKGLFSKAIMESGSIILFTENELPSNLNLSQKVAEIVGCASDTKTMESDPESIVSCLRNHSANYLAQALWFLNPTTSISLYTQYGDELFPRNPVEDIRNGNFHNVPLLIGNNRDEGSVFMTTVDPETFGFFGQKNTLFNKTFSNQIIVNFLSMFFYSNPEKYVKYYLDSVADDDYEAIRTQTNTAIGDAVFLCPTVYFAESYAKRKNDVYFYFFVHRPSSIPWSPWMGVAHYEEVQFVFGQPVRKPDLYNSIEIDLSRKMIDVWSNFAKNGIPSNSFYWPKFSKEEPNFVYLNATVSGEVYGTGPHFNNCNFLRNHYKF